MTTQLNDLTDQTVFVTVKDCATLPFAIPGPNRVIVVRQDWSKSPDRYNYAFIMSDGNPVPSDTISDLVATVNAHKPDSLPSLTVDAATNSPRFADNSDFTDDRISTLITVYNTEKGLLRPLPAPASEAVASSLHPQGDPPSANTSSPRPSDDPSFGKSYADGLPRYFTVVPHSKDGDLTKGCTVKFSLHRYGICDGTDIARKWARQFNLEDVGSGCSLCGDPIRDIDFEPLRTLPLALDQNCLLPRLYRIEIEGNLLSVTFETRRIPNGDFKAVSDFIKEWALVRCLKFCSSCHDVPDSENPDYPTRSIVTFCPEGDLGGHIDLAITPGRKDPNRKDPIAPSEDCPCCPPTPPTPES